MDFLDRILCKHGVFNILKKDTYICKSLLEYGEWSELEIDLYKDIIKTDDIIIEVGSHIGSHTVPLSKIAKEGCLYAFEPQLLLFNLLNNNIKENNISNTEIYLEAVSNKEETVKLNQVDYKELYKNNDEINSGGLDFKVLVSNNDGYEINVITLDNKFKHLEKLDFIKIDAEGNEFEILKGGKNLINRFHPIIYLEFIPGENLKTIEILNFLDSFNYISYTHITPLFNVSNFKKNEVNIFSNISSFMILSIPRSSLETTLELILIKNYCKKIINSQTDNFI
jgi:FkbM family methyltransferase